MPKYELKFVFNTELPISEVKALQCRCEMPFDLKDIVYRGYLKEITRNRRRNEPRATQISN